jgi:hypothetical protein
MLEPLAERTVIIGNSGSGKSTLAEAVASLVHIPVIDLDLLHWEEDGYGVNRTFGRSQNCWVHDFGRGLGRCRGWNLVVGAASIPSNDNSLVRQRQFAR